MEDRVAKVTHDRMTEEHNHEVLKKENIRLRDELQRVRNDNHRDKEQWKRDQDNMMGTVNLDHKREIDKMEMKHQRDVDKLQGTIEEKNKDIILWKEKFSSKEAELAQTKNEHKQEMSKMEENIEEANEEKITKMQNEHIENTRKKDTEIKQLQKEISSSENKRNKEKDDQMANMRKQCDDERKYYIELLQNEKSDAKKNKQEMEDLMKNQVDRYNKLIQDLEMDIRRNHEYDEEINIIKVKELEDKHSIIETKYKIQLVEAKRNIKKLEDEINHQKSEFMNTMKINLANLESDLTEKFKAEKAAKIHAVKEDCQYWINVKEEELNQALEIAKYDANLVYERAVRMERRCNDLGRQTLNK